MNDADRTFSAEGHSAVRVLDIVLAVVVLGITGVGSVLLALASVMTVMMSDSCGTGPDEPFICSDNGGIMWMAAEAFLAVGLIASIVLGFVWMLRRAKVGRTVTPAALAGAGGCILTVLIWVGWLAVLAH